MRVLKQKIDEAYASPIAIYSLFGFEVTPGVIPAVSDVPVPIDLWRVRTGGSPLIGKVDAIDRQLVQIPGVDVRAEVAGLPAERACSIPGEGR